MMYVTMHEYVRNYYPSEGWKNKVDRMPQEQVIAIYHSFIHREKAQKKFEKIEKEEYNPQYHQINIFEYMAKKDIQERLGGKN